MAEYKFQKDQVVVVSGEKHKNLILQDPTTCLLYGEPAYKVASLDLAKPYYRMVDNLEKHYPWEVVPEPEAQAFRERITTHLNVNDGSLPKTHVFQVDQYVKHVKSGGVYVITMTPDRGRLEATNTPAYSYTSIAGGPVWHRAQTEMEDGRFEVWVK